MIQATEADRDAILAALMPHAERAMFPPNNLLQHGMDTDHPLGVSMWLTREGGKITDVLTLTNRGMVMPFLPSGSFAEAASHLRGRQIAGIVGPLDWARGVEDELHLKGPSALDHDEPHFLLDIAAMTLPDGPGQIVPLDEAPAETIKAWMLDYQLATLGTPPDKAAERVAESYAQYCENRSHVVLMEAGTPLAMTGFNARIPGMVQVGGVYTPPALRGQGHARRALALHLTSSGAARATLFSASEAAARAYRSIGFRRIGDWTLLLLTEPESV